MKEASLRKSITISGCSQRCSSACVSCMSYGLTFKNLFQTLEGLQEDVDERRARAASHNTTLQGFVVKVVSPSASVYYVVIDDLRYACASVVAALDLLMKCHLVFNLEYNFETRVFLNLFQKGVLKITTKLDKNTPRLVQMLNELVFWKRPRIIGELKV